MKEIFCFSLSYGKDLSFPYEDHWYFTNPPTKEDLQKAILVHKETCELNWKWLYEEFKLMIKDPKLFEDERPDHESSLTHSGGPVRDGTFSFSKFQVINNEQSSSS